MTDDKAIREGWICANYLHSMCRQMQIFPIQSTRALKLLIDKLREQSNTILSEETEFLEKIIKNEFHPNTTQLEICEVFLQELSAYSTSGIESLFLEYARERLSEDRAIIRNNKIDSLGI